MLRASDAAGPIFDQYWRFAAERQAIFFRRLEGLHAPWSEDEIFQEYKFTNAYRASDRVSQFLIKEVIYNPIYSISASEVVFRVLLFKLFNKISTWKLIERELGTPSWQGFDFRSYDEVLTRAFARGEKLYSAAYIIPPVRLDTDGVKHRGHLKLIEMIMGGDFVFRAQKAEGLAGVFELLKEYPSLGDFLAFQLSIDINYSEVINHNEAEFVVAGPGAKDGIAKTFPGATGRDPVEVIQYMMDRQEEEFDRLGIEFRSLWGRRLQLIDCQNLFCEISKYTRVSHPEVVGVSGRTRIKQSFRPQLAPVQPWYPPKWRLNESIPVYQAAKFGDGVFGGF